MPVTHLQLLWNTVLHGPGYTEDAAWALCVWNFTNIWDSLGKKFL